MSTFILEIVSPERIAYSKPVEQVSVPSETGQLTILPHHIGLFATLVEGELIIKTHDEEEYLAIGGGFVEVTKDKVSVLVSRAYNASELNELAIEKARKEAEEAIIKGATGEELAEKQAMLRSTLIDLHVARRRRKKTIQ